MARREFEDKRPRHRYAAESKRLLSVLDGHLRDKAWMLGDGFSIVDIAMWPWVRNLVGFYGFWRLGVVVNNAGYGIAAFAGIGIYHASKWALEGFSQSLALEVAAFGIKVTLVEPGSFSTDWGDVSARHAAPLPAYGAFRQQAEKVRAARKAGRGDPAATRAAILTLVDAPEPPLRLLLGDGPLAVATREYEARLATWRAWEPVSVAAQGTAPRSCRSAGRSCNFRT